MAERYRPPPPRASPRPRTESEPLGAGVEEITGSHEATRDFVREVARTGLWKTSWALVVTAASLVAGTLWAYRAAAQEAHDAGISAAAVVKLQADATQRELERFQGEVNTRLGRVERAGDRTEQKMDALLDKLNVRNPAPRDGGP